MKIIAFWIALILLFGLIACKRNKTGTFIVKGKVINIATKQPIDSVLVILHGGNPMSNPFMPGFNTNPPDNNNDSAYTNENGEFRVEVKHESFAFIGWVKKGYKNGNIKGGNKFSSPGLINAIIEYEAECSFHPIFRKKTNNNPDDTLLIYIENFGYPKSYYGKSPFRLNDDLGYCIGDTYFHYKLKYKQSNSWNEKIDSVYVKSLATYSDTIFY